jgi:hypothetical protein
MAFTESDRVSIRKYLGAGSLYLQLFPKLENAITIVQSLADGGQRPDNSTELEIKTYLAKLVALETKMEQLHCQFQIDEAGLDNVKLNASRALYVLRSEGRRYIGVISRILACAPTFDYFSSQAPSANDFASIYSTI